MLIGALLISACGGEQSVSGWVRAVEQRPDSVQFTILTDTNPPEEITLNIIGQLEGGGENFDANHLLDHAIKGLPIAVSYVTEPNGELTVVRATDAIWLADRTPPTLP
jgi:hypothetical protein